MSSRLVGCLPASYLRREEAAFGGDYGDEDAIVGGDLAHELGDAEVVVLGHGIELLGEVQSDDGDLATGLVEDRFLRSCDAGHDWGSLDMEVCLEEVS